MGNLTHTVSGDIASFRTPSKVPIESLKFHFLPKQASGTPSPDNPIPIEGWTGVNGGRSGKNLLNADEADQYNAIEKVNGKFVNTLTDTRDQVQIYFEGFNITGNQTTLLGQFGAVTGITSPRVVSKTISITSKYENMTHFSIKHNGKKRDFRVYFPIKLPIGAVLKCSVEVFSVDVTTVGGFSMGNIQLEVGENATNYESYSGEQIPITFPIAGTNKLNPNDIDVYARFELVNGVYRNTDVDTRTTIQLSVQLWKTTGTYIKTAKVDYVTTIGRHAITFDVDEPECRYIVFKHNGMKKDFILIFPRRLGFGTFTISCDVLANDPTTIGGVQLTNIQLEVGDTAHAFEPYSSDNTFYGGYIDPVAGEIVSEYGSYTFTGIPEDSLTYTKENTVGGKARHQFNTTVLDGIAKKSSIRHAYSDIASANLWDSPDITNDNLFYIGTPTKQVALYVSSSECDATVESFSAWLSNHPWTIVYQLATPIHIPIASQDMKAFLDHNNFWSDANDVAEVTYPITESKDMLTTHKKAMDFDHAHHKKVKWNNMAGAMNSQYWVRYNSNMIDAEFENNEALITVKDISSNPFSMSIRTNGDPLVYSNHRYYVSYCLYPYFDDAYFGAEFGNNVYTGYFYFEKNKWSRFSYSSKAGGDGMGRMYIPYFKPGSYAIGDSVRIKNAYYIDLTLMFGAGNEPTTVFEFEHICAINGIDLTTYQPYDEGSDRWLIIP